MKKLFLFLIIALSTLSLSAQVPDEMGFNGQRPDGPPPDGMKFGKKAMDRKVKAEKKAAKKKKEAEDEMVLGKVAGKLYLFGCSTEFGDSALYVSAIQEVDSIAVSKKFKFLPYRQDFSQQLKDKLELGDRKLKHQTSAVFFAEKKKDLDKRYNKLIKRTLKKGDLKIVSIPAEEFQFVHPLDYYPQYNE